MSVVVARYEPWTLYTCTTWICMLSCFPEISAPRICRRKFEKIHTHNETTCSKSFKLLKLLFTFFFFRGLNIVPVSIFVSVFLFSVWTCFFPLIFNYNCFYLLLSTTLEQTQCTSHVFGACWVIFMFPWSNWTLMWTTGLIQEQVSKLVRDKVVSLFLFHYNSFCVCVNFKSVSSRRRCLELFEICHCKTEQCRWWFDPAAQLKMWRENGFATSTPLRV